MATSWHRRHKEIGGWPPTMGLVPAWGVAGVCPTATTNGGRLQFLYVSHAVPGRLAAAAGDLGRGCRGGDGQDGDVGQQP